MKAPDLTLAELLAHPKVRVNEYAINRIEKFLSDAEQASKEPIYLRILAGIGAWFAALFLIIFLGTANIINNGASAVICGGIILVAAIAIAGKSVATFLSQLSLALALTGNSLFIWGIADMFGHYQLQIVLFSHAIVCILVYPLYANSIYRFLAPVALVVIATTWIFQERFYASMHLLIAAEMLLAGSLLLRRRRPPMLTPLVYAAATMLPATMLFMNFMQVSLWWRRFSEPLWPSSLLLAAGLIYLYLHLAGGFRRLREPWLILAIVATVLLGIFTSPGILVAIGLITVGHAFGDRVLTSLAYIFLPCFLVLFYYALNIDLANKSWVIAGSGGLLLLVRWIVKYLQPEEVET